jgi:DNA-binding response OmpR family regulator
MTLNISNLDLAGKIIVIVEDDLPSIMYYETLLKNTGAEVYVFRTGKDFVDYLSEGNRKIDLLFIDYLIPFVNGIDCTRFFRKTNKSSPVLMVTAYSSDQTKTESFLAGCNEFVLKPVYPEKIFFLLEKYLLREVRVPESFR